MNKRLIWLVVAVALILFGYFVNRRLGPPASADSYALPSVPAAPSTSQFAPPPLPPPTFLPADAPAPRIVLPESVSRPQVVPLVPEIPIQDGATIDFSIGAPVVRSGGADTEALDRALREMAEATRNTTFPPPPEQPAEPEK